MPKLTLKLGNGGGHLVTRHSADEAGPANYVVKRDWRREKNDEVRREGDRYFGAGVATATASKTANFTAGTGDDTKQFTCTAALTVSFDSVAVGWYALFVKESAAVFTVTVGSLGTLTAAGDRILAVMTPDGLVDALQVGFDADPTLIFTARRDDGKTALIIGTPTKLYRYWAVEDYAIVASGVYETGIYGSITGGLWLTIGSGFTTENAHRWEARNVAGYTVFNNGIDLPATYHLSEFAVSPIHELREQGVAYVGTIEELEGILLLADIGVIHADYLETVMDNVGYGGFANGQEQFIDRVHYRIMWGDPVGPRRWGASVPADIGAGSRILTLDYRFDSVRDGDAIRVAGAGANGGDLLTTVLFHANSTALILADKAQTTVNQAAASRQDAASLIVGRFDTLDISSPILRLKKFQDRLVVAKSTGFALGEYTGDAATPFVFQSLYAKDEEDDCLHWRWTLMDVRGEYLVYAGKTEFYRFDLVTRRPQVHPVLTMCSDVFFSQIGAATQDQVFAALNSFTKEVLFLFPSASDDKALALYYGLGAAAEVCQTLGVAYTAMGTVSRPSRSVVHGADDKMLVAGVAGSKLVEYGYDRNGPFLWTRRGAQVTSALYPGYADFGSSGNEKHLSSYLLILASQSPNNAITVAFYGVRNPSEELTQLPDSPVVFSSPATRNVAYLHYLVHLIQERLTATGTGNVRISTREWRFGRVGSSNFVRR